MSKQQGEGMLGHSKHRTSGVPKNHALSIQKVREYNKALEEEKKRKEATKPKMVSNVKDVFKK